MIYISKQTLSTLGKHNKFVKEKSNVAKNCHGIIFKTKKKRDGKSKLFCLSVINFHKLYMLLKSDK